MSTNTIIGRLGNERGQRAELRVEIAVREAFEKETLPSWIIGYQRACHEDDEKGIDGWLDTDVGRIKIQVKSSYAGAREFSRRHQPDIAIIIVRNNKISPEQILDLLIQAVTPLRRRYLEIRQNDW